MNIGVLPDMDMVNTETASGIGHNSGLLEVTIEARLFNSLSQYRPPGSGHQTLTFPAGSTIGDVIRKLNLPHKDIFLVLRNGRDVSSGVVGGPINSDAVLDDGDVIALSGPVPYSFGYGAPVV